MMKEWKETIWRRQYTILGDKLFDSFHLPSWWVTLYTPVTSHPGLTILTIRSICGPWCCVDHISLSLNFSGYTPVAQQLSTNSCLSFTFEINQQWNQWTGNVLNWFIWLIVWSMCVHSILNETVISWSLEEVERAPNCRC